MRDALSAWIDAHADQIIAETQAVLRIASVSDAATIAAGAPFGRAVADALDHTLGLCARLGMATENFGGYAGHATFGTGNEIAAMLGHLDVVPAGSGWTRDPWGGAVDNGYLWGRGASDDKGPTFAALWGAKAVLDSGAKLSRRIRLIFGCDEESGWQCMAHYFGVAGQPRPTVAFTPDAFFPLVHAEKGSFTAVAEKIVEESHSPLRVVAFRSGLRANMVPGEAAATLAGEAGALGGVAHVLAAVENITVEQTGDGLLIVRARGKGAHGSTPEQGVNAALVLLRALSASGSSFDDLAHGDAAWMTDLARRGAPDGATLGIGGRDALAGPLTSNLGVVMLESGTVRATFNVRYPPTWNGDETIERFQASLAQTGWRVLEPSHTPPLYVPLDQEPVKTLLRVYREHTGDMTPPATMGGRTYATTVAPVGVAFGAAMPGDPETAHQADERFAVERLLQCAKIYAHALYELAR